MRKAACWSILLLLLLTTTATSCEEDEWPDEEYPLCSVTGMSVSHWDNTGVMPQLPNQNKIAKEAYLMEILLTTDGIYDDWKYSMLPALQDSIAKINIYTIHPLNQEYPADADITSCFKEYPLSLKNKIDDSTVRGYPITHLKAASSLYKALFAVPDAGTHQFRVVLTFTSGLTMEAESKPIELY